MSSDVKKDVEPNMHLVIYDETGFCKECKSFFIMSIEDDFDDILICIDCKKHVAYNDSKIKTKCIFCNPPTNTRCSNISCKNPVLFYKWHIPYYYCKHHALQEYGAAYITGLVEIPPKCIELIKKSQHHTVLCNK
jgi:hypothetical protein